MASMHLSAPEMAKLVGWVSTAGAQANMELEAVVQQDAYDVNRETFTRAIERLKAAAWRVQELPEQLDVGTAGGMRTTIVGAQNMSAFFNAPPPRASVPQAGAKPVKRLPTGVSVIRKVRVDEPLDVREYGVRFNLKSEEPVEGEAAHSHLRSLVDLSKSFRLKKRHRLTHADRPGVALDFTVVKSRDAQFKSVAAANISSAPPVFEVEAELLGEASAEAFVAVVAELLVAVEGGLPLTTATERGAAARDYVQGVFGSASQDKTAAGPKPVTLEMKHLLPSTSAAAPSVLSGYSVTDKADGETALLWVDARGRAVLLNDQLRARNTGIVLPAAHHRTLLHGELLLLEQGARFMAFDLYLDCGKDVRSLPLISVAGDSRAARLHKFAALGAVKAKGVPLAVDVKKFFVHEDVHEAARQVLNGFKAGNYPYSIDGLIYTPCDLPVGASQMGMPPRWGGTWERVFKWKPAKQNTIDFEVRFPKQQDGKEIVTMHGGVLHKIAHLYVGYHTTQDAAFTPLGYLTNQGGVKEKRAQYVAQVFSPDDDADGSLYEAYLPMAGAGGAVKCANKDEILEGSVAEFAYAPDKAGQPSALRWVPLRVRHDKNAKAKETGRTAANAHKTANSVWRSICMPVTEELVTGQRKMTEEEERFASAQEGVYYANMESRRDSVMKAMRDFHNYWIKWRTLFEPLKGRRSLLDLGCGKGGDLNKIMDAGFADVVGLDLFEDNITNPANGAISRLQKATRQRQQRLKGAHHQALRYVFAPFDVSQGLDAVHINKVEDAGTRAVLQALWAVVPRQMVKPKALAGYHALAAGGFDVVSCQFAMHYMCDDAQTFERFAQTVARNLKPGGRFVGTCMDGARVGALLKGVASGESVARTAEDRIVWSVTKRYDGDFADDAGTPRSFGRAIDVYLESIGTTNKEYLVDYATVKKVLEKADVLEVETGMFGDAYEAMKRGAATPSGDDKAVVASALGMTKAEMEFSFCNRWFVFEKRRVTATAASPLPRPP